jgi:transposase
MLTVGLDVHQSCSSVCILDEKGNRVRQQEIHGGWDQVVAELGKLREPFQICYEASTGYGALYERLTPLAKKVAVAHPGKLRLIFLSKKKHNRADAAKLATLLHLNQVPSVHVPSQAVRSWRGLIEHRRRLVDKRVMVKNQIRALLRGYGLRGGHRSCLWTKAGEKWLAELTWPTAMETLRVGVMLEELVDIQKKIDTVTAGLEAVGGKHSGVALLMTIPGVGPRTAEAFVAYVDDPHRFRSGTVGSYFGLVPREDSTGNVRHLGHVTREGPSTVRKLLTEAAWRGACGDGGIKAVYERLLRGDKGRRKLAVVALGHWLCRVMLAMLKTGEAYRGKAACASPAVEAQTIKQCA